MTGNLSVTIQGTTDFGPCPAALSTSTEQFSGTAQINDTVQNYEPTDSSVLNLSGKWSTDYCSGSASGQASGSVTGFSTDPTVEGTVVDWNRDVTNPGQYGLALAFHGDGSVNQTGDTGGCADGYDTQGADFNVGINFPEPSGFFGTEPIDQTLTYGGSDTEGNTWTGGPYPCSAVDVSDVTVHITGSITVSPLSSSAGGSGGTGSGGAGGNGSGSGGRGSESSAAGNAKGNGTATASGNGTVTVGSVSCAGPGPCSESTTVGSNSSGKHATRKVTYAHGKLKIQAGKTVKVKVKLTKAGLRKLKKAGKLKTTVTIIIASAGKQTIIRHFKLTIKAPKK